MFNGKKVYYFSEDQVNVYPLCMAPRIKEGNRIVMRDRYDETNGLVSSYVIDVKRDGKNVTYETMNSFYTNDPDFYVDESVLDYFKTLEAELSGGEGHA